MTCHLTRPRETSPPCISCFASTAAPALTDLGDAVLQGAEQVDYPLRLDLGPDRSHPTTAADGGMAHAQFRSDRSGRVALTHEAAYRRIRVGVELRPSRSEGP